MTKLVVNTLNDVWMFTYINRTLYEYNHKSQIKKKNICCGKAPSEKKTVYFIITNVRLTSSFL